MHACTHGADLLRFLFAAETLIPILRQSVPTPFPADMEKSKQEELTQCTQQAIEAIEALQEAIGEVAKSKESWKRFFTANKYIERMTEAKTRVETAVDLIQKHVREKSFGRALATVVPYP